MTSQSHSSIAGGLWEEFVTSAWEKRAVVLSGIMPETLVSEADLFRTFLEASKRYRASLENGLVFWVDGKTIADCAEHLPQASDESLRGYTTRVERELGDYTVLLANPHLYDDSLWERVRLFVRGLHAHTGVSNGGADTTFFLGRYRRTPFGVHRGQMSVLTFPVCGPKRFRVWPRGYGEAHPEIEGLVDYPDHAQASAELSGAPGDVMYWPADIWHIGEGGDEFAATLSIGFWWDRAPLTRVLLELSRQLAESIEQPDPRGITFPPETVLRNGAAPAKLPGSVVEALRAVRAIADGKDLDLALSTEWLQAMSADSFREVPPLRPASPDVSSVQTLRRSPASRILFASAGNTRLTVAANGHIHIAAANQVVRSLLRDLNLKGIAHLTAAIWRSRPAQELIQWLYQAGAVEEKDVNQPQAAPALSKAARHR